MNMKNTPKKTAVKYVTEKTFEKSMANHSEVMALILKEIKAIHEENKYFRENIFNLNSDGLSYNRKIENLTIRVEKLELNDK